MIVLISLPFLPETPRWLLEYRSWDDAKKALVRLRNSDTSPHLIDAELEEIKETLYEERQMSQGVKLFDMFRGINRRRTAISISVMIALAGSGALFPLIYGTYFFSIAGQTEAFQESVGMTAAGLTGTMFSMWLVTKIGRRSILLIGYAAQGVCMLVIGIVWSVNSTSVVSGRLLVAFVIIYIWFYNAAAAPYLYLVAGEVPTQRLRSYTVGTSIGVSFFFNWVCSYTAPYFLNPTDLNWI